MPTNFQLLFSARVVHNYFENDICNCLQFSPAETTENILNKYGFKIRRNIDGFDLFSSSDLAAAGLLNYIKAASGLDHFNFDITNTNSNFVFFTELPADWLWQMEYDSQDPLNSTDNNSIVLHLTLAEQKNSSVIGSLKVYFDDIVSLAGKNRSVNYIIRLQARSTQWQYYIINKNSVSLSNPSISGKANINFKGPENVKLKNGEDALLFYSDRADLPLTQVPTFKFDLVNTAANNTANTIKRNSVAKIVFKNLPGPDPANMGTVMIDGKIRPVSPMYIYI